MTLSAWDVYGELSTREFEALSSSQRNLVSVLDLRQEVNSGGFENYFRAWGGNTAPVALGALPGLISQEWAELLSEAMSLFGAAYPSDPDERGDFIDANDLYDALSDLDSRYYELEGTVEADAILDEWVKAHPETAPSGG